MLKNNKLLTFLVSFVGTGTLLGTGFGVWVFNENGELNLSHSIDGINVEIATEAALGHFKNDESGYHYVTGTDFSSGMMIKEVNFLFMIEIHVKCRNLLMRNQCLTRENQQMIDNAICGLALAMFLEIPKVNICNITHLLRQLENYKEVYGSLKNYDTSFKQLKFFILRKSVLLLYIYLCIWKSYLYFKRIR